MAVSWSQTVQRICFLYGSANPDRFVASARNGVEGIRPCQQLYYWWRNALEFFFLHLLTSHRMKPVCWLMHGHYSWAKGGGKRVRCTNNRRRSRRKGKRLEQMLSSIIVENVASKHTTGPVSTPHVLCCSLAAFAIKILHFNNLLLPCVLSLLLRPSVCSSLILAFHFTLWFNCFKGKPRR